MKNDCIKQNEKSYRNNSIKENKMDVYANKLRVTKSEIDKCIISNLDETKKVYELHFELGKLDYLDDKETFFKNAKIKKGIIRKVLVPSDITLHSLHYMIQKLFGWTNSHLHEFLMQEDDLYKFTAFNLDNWLDLCGICFRFYLEEDNDFFWDDDYDESQCFNIWMKKKYLRPYITYDGNDTFLRNFDYSNEEKATTNYLTNKSEYCSQDKLFSKFNTGNTSILRENLRIDEVLTLDEVDTHNWTVRWKKKRASMIRKINKNSIECQKIIDDMKVLSSLYATINYYRGKSEIVNNDLRKQLIRNTFSKIIPYQDRIFDSIKKYQIVNDPMTNTIKYRYDFGDSWEVIITVKEIYSIQEDNVYDSKNCLPNDKLKDKIINAYNKPICLSVDGLNLIDDFGGISGFERFLNALNTNKELDGLDTEGLLKWAKSLGWTYKKKNAKNAI